MNCGQKCLKWLMFIFNFIFFVCGGVLLGLGIWAIIDGSTLKELVAENPWVYNGIYIIIAVGAGILVISFLGCCGAAKESRCLLGTFFAIVMIIFVLQVVGASLAFVYRTDTEQAIYATFVKYNGSNPGDQAITDSWDSLQTLLQCCGYGSYKDWTETTDKVFPNAAGEQIPDSCCTRDSISLDGMFIDRTACVNLTGNFHNTGCKSKFDSYFWAIGGAGIGILVVEVLAMVFACCLFCAVGKED